MYLILVKYFYYFYYLKKNKKFKFFILIDLIFYLMKKYFKILLLKRKLNKYKNLIRKLTFKIKNINIKRCIYYLNKLESLIQFKMDEFNYFIIHFLPTQLLPLGNRKKFYNLLNKKFKRFFILIKKKLNKKFFFFFLVQLFRKIKFLFLKSDSFLNKKTFIFDFFSMISLESKYSSLLQLYRQVQKKDSLLKNKYLSFFNLVAFFFYRIDFFLFKIFSFFSLEQIRKFIFSNGIKINNKKINTILYSLTQYDLLEIPKTFGVSLRRFYLFSLQSFFTLLNSINYKKYNIKRHYFNILYSIIKNKKNVFSYLAQIKKKKTTTSCDVYLDTIDQIFEFFFLLKNKHYNFDLLNTYKENYKIEYQFPFFIKKEKRELFFNINPKYLCNVSFFYSICSNKNNMFSFFNFINYINLFFFLYRFKYIYYYTIQNKLICSPTIFYNLIVEQKKMFYYFTAFFNINIVGLI